MAESSQSDKPLSVRVVGCWDNASIVQARYNIMINNGSSPSKIDAKIKHFTIHTCRRAAAAAAALHMLMHISFCVRYMRFGSRFVLPQFHC